LDFGDYCIFVIFDTAIRDYEGIGGSDDTFHGEVRKLGARGDILHFIHHISD
jgi:hypothetical protein